ncbi:FAD/FMN-containing dehydrogenase [Nakamurella panacisegetis]|uniref:FAD/FMN-containing dehydrogenase n=2 Tax=Nakamurella panacisegetis TaxID=1090615 RepID=A0A1H0LS10_9ACTN|nr:FAD/FMN-containing dehydrogenase [Nakamurella panacisegetis]
MDALARIVGPDHVLTDDALTAGYLRDWTGRFGTTSGTVVRPADTAQVSEVLALCRAEGRTVVPQGGNTGLVGGSVPRDQQIVLSLARLRGAPVVDAPRRQIVAAAGVTISTLQQAAVAAGFRYGVDLASRESATVGGTIATNAGGLRVLRSGDTRAQLIGVEAVLADGTVISHLDGHTRDNTGYHVPSLLAGSEGTLAVVTTARLRLLPVLGRPAVALIGLADPAEAVVAAGRIASLPSVTAVELMLPPGLALVMQRLGFGRPLAADHGAYLVVEAVGDDPLSGVVGVIEQIPGADAVVAQDQADVARLWAYRDRHTEAIAMVGTAIKMDVTLPMSSLGSFLLDVPGAVAGVSPDARTWLFGHVADGNVHVNVTGADLAVADDIEDVVFHMVAAAGGSISSEHGVGLTKRPWLHLNRSVAELALFASIKRAFDPSGVLNPGVLIP